MTSYKQKYFIFNLDIGLKKLSRYGLAQNRSSIELVFWYPRLRLNSTIVTSRCVQFETLVRRLLFAWTLPMESVLPVLWGGGTWEGKVPNGQVYTDNIKTQPSGTTVLHLSNSILSVCATLSAQQSVWPSVLLLFLTQTCTLRYSL